MLQRNRHIGVFTGEMPTLPHTWRLAFWPSLLIFISRSDDSHHVRANSAFVFSRSNFIPYRKKRNEDYL